MHAHRGLEPIILYLVVDIGREQGFQLGAGVGNIVVSVRGGGSGSRSECRGSLRAVLDSGVPLKHAGLVALVKVIISPIRLRLDRHVNFVCVHLKKCSERERTREKKSEG